MKQPTAKQRRKAIQVRKIWAQINASNDALSASIQKERDSKPIEKLTRRQRVLRFLRELSR